MTGPHQALLKSAPYNKKPWLVASLGQVTLEFTLIFVATTALLAGLISLWKWSSDNIIKRQISYNDTRQAAGQISSGQEPPATYEAEEMQENEVYLLK
ncbi:MAG: hypothetical protein V1869_00050 [Candidatus Omnitrophota bacterium]